MPKPKLDVSPEEEAFLKDTFHRHARAYLAISVFALGLAVAGLGFGLRNAQASDVAPPPDPNHFAEQRDQVAAVRQEVVDQIEASQALDARLAELEAKLLSIQDEQAEAPTSDLDAKLAEAHRRLRALERKQGITAAPVSTSVYKRLNELEARLSVVELERG